LLIFWDKENEFFLLILRDRGSICYLVKKHEKFNKFDEFHSSIDNPFDW